MVTTLLVLVLGAASVWALVQWRTYRMQERLRLSGQVGRVIEHQAQWLLNGLDPTNALDMPTNAELINDLTVIRRMARHVMNLAAGNAHGVVPEDLQPNKEA